MTLTTSLSRPLGIAAVAAFSVVLLSTPTPASAKSRLHHVRSAHAYHDRHYASHHSGRRFARRHARHVAAADRSQPVEAYTGFGSNVVEEARRYIGGNPTGRRSLWCARFMNMVLEHSGYHGSGSDMASSFAGYGRRLPGPQVGAIAVMSRGRRGGHVGIVSGIDAKGNPIVISGNHGHRVAEAVYSVGRVYAYVMPN